MEITEVRLSANDYRDAGGSVNAIARTSAIRGRFKQQTNNELLILAHSDYPRSLRELRMRLSSEESCRDFLFDLRWPDGFRCARCEGSKWWPIEGKRYQCASCGFQTSVTSGTIFQNTREPLLLWFRVIWWMIGQTGPTTASALQRISGLRSYETAWTWLQKLRCVMAPNAGELLRGVVEVDYTQFRFQRPAHHDTDAVSAIMLAVAAQADDGGSSQIRLRTSLRRSDLRGFVQETVAKNSVLVTSASFPLQNARGLGYIHDRRISSASENEPADVPRVQAVMPELAAWLANVRAPEQLKYLQSYIDEFSFRYNSRRIKTHGERFINLLRRAVQVNPHPRKSLSAGRDMPPGADAD